MAERTDAQGSRTEEAAHALQEISTYIYSYEGTFTDYEISRTEEAILMIRTAMNPHAERRARIIHYTPQKHVTP